MKKIKILIILIFIFGLSLILTSNLLFGRTDLLAVSNIVLEKDEANVQNFIIPHHREVYVFFSFDNAQTFNFSIFNLTNDLIVTNINNKNTNFATNFYVENTGSYQFVLINEGDTLLIENYNIFHKSFIEPIILIIIGLIIIFADLYFYLRNMLY